MKTLIAKILLSIFVFMMSVAFGLNFSNKKTESLAFFVWACGAVGFILLVIW